MTTTTVLTDRAGRPLTDYCLRTRPDVFWGPDATRTDADRYNAELARMVTEEFGLPVRLVLADPPHSTQCSEIEAWIDGHWQDAVIAPTCECECDCDAPATTTDEAGHRCCEECARLVARLQAALPRVADGIFQIIRPAERHRRSRDRLAEEIEACHARLQRGGHGIGERVAGSG